MLNSKPILIFIFFTLISSSANANQILYIGDSQSAGYLGKIVYESLSSQGTKADVYGVSSSSPRHWGSPGDSWNGKWLCKRKGRHNKSFEIPLKDKICIPKDKKSSLQFLLNQKKYTHVVFQFLGNSTHLESDKITGHLNQMLGNLGNQKCLFITSPPHFGKGSANNKKRKQVEDHFVKVIGSRCQISRGMSGTEMDNFSNDQSNYIKDQVHLSKKGAKIFFDQKVKDQLPK